MKKRILLSVVLFITLILTVTGCGSKDEYANVKFEDGEHIVIKDIYKVTEQNKELDKGLYTTLVVVAYIRPTEDLTMYNKDLVTSDEFYLTSTSGNRVLVNAYYTSLAAQDTGITAGTVAVSEAESKSFILSAGDTRKVLFTFFTANKNVDGLNEIEFNYLFPLDLNDESKTLSGKLTYPVSDIKSVEYYSDIA